MGNNTLCNYWLSWWQPTNDPRPVSVDFEGRGKIMGWWVSGEDMEGKHSLCAWVRGKSEKEVKKLIQKYWPEAIDWRFCVLKGDDFNPGDRFPMKKVE